MTIAIQPGPPPSPLSPTSLSCEVAAHDPPPPYPSRERRTRTARSVRRHRLQTTQHAQLASTDSHSDYEVSPSPHILAPVPFPDDLDEGEPTETTPFLAQSSPTSTRRSVRPRSQSHTSATSLAPSLAQTVMSLFRSDDESVYDELEERPLLLADAQYEDQASVPSRRRHGGFFSKAAWTRYFRPLVRMAYYRPLFHLLVVNFPYALAAWVYLFVFTVVRIPIQFRFEFFFPELGIPKISSETRTVFGSFC